MATVQSNDGTTIAFDQVGEGPAIILVGGALSVRSNPSAIDLASRLARLFTVVNYDRRGRGESGDTSPYAVEREVEDIDALVEAVGGSAFLSGHSSGAVLALEAANRLPGKVTKLAMYEPPFIVDDSRPALPPDYVARVAALAKEHPGDAVAYFMRVAAETPAEIVAAMRQDPMWAEMEAVAQTLAYDGAVMGATMSGTALPAERWNRVVSPVLVMTGGASEAWVGHGTDALARLLPQARRQVLAGQHHVVAGDVLAPVLAEFFAG